jgi:hypothetical protein
LKGEEMEPLRISSKLGIAVNLVFTLGSALATVMYGKDVFNGIKLRTAALEVGGDFEERVLGSK